jgi:hypothetical protein
MEAVVDSWLFVVVLFVALFIFFIQFIPESWKLWKSRKHDKPMNPHDTDIDKKGDFIK